MYTIETEFDQTYIVAIDTGNSFPDVEVFVNEDGTAYIKQVKFVEVEGQKLEIVDVIALSPSQFYMLKAAIFKPDGVYPIRDNSTALDKLIKEKKEDDMD